MGFVDLLSWLADRTVGSEPEAPPIDQGVIDMAADAAGQSVTPEVLVNHTERSYVALLEYLEDDERPEYVIRGGTVLIGDAEESLAREYPTRETQVVVSDRRLLVVLGRRITDDVWEVPLEDVVEMYVDDVEALNRYLVVEASRESTQMTFYVDVTIEPSTRDLRESVEYVADYEPRQ